MAADLFLWTALFLVWIDLMSDIYKPLAAETSTTIETENPSAVSNQYANQTVNEYSENKPIGEREKT